eukprot:m.186665 g.186665  ORF g.186665 m.186665 type:complete len:232 (+) comp15593_c0_seq9:217-912(+)
MGRVARYKRVKGDPRDRAPLPPPPAPRKESDDYLPRSARMLLANKKKHDLKRKRPANQSDETSTEEGTKSKKKKKTKDKKEDQTALKRKPKETLRAFGLRVDKENADKVRAVIVSKTNKAAKRKAWNKKKIEAKKQAKSQIVEDGDDAYEKLHKVDRPSFGEVVDRPPEILFDAKLNEKRKATKAPLLLASQFSKKAVTPPIKRAAMEEERSRVIMQYRQNKAKKLGSFVM